MLQHDRYFYYSIRDRCNYYSLYHFQGCDLGGRNNSDIRLTGSTNQGSGHVEIHVGNQWGIGVPSVMCSGGLRMLKLLVGIWVTVEPCRLLVEDVSILFALYGLICFE